MLRFIVAVVVGYLVMAILVVAASAVALVAPDLAFRQDSYDVRTGWLVWTLVVGAVAAVAGGFVAVVIARRRSAATVLAGLVLAVGLISALANLGKERPTGEPPAGLSLPERASRAVQPTWYAIFLPVLGAGGVLAGARLRRPKL
jgi:hypothetical protein